MIADIGFIDATPNATITPLHDGVVYRIPVSQSGVMMMTSRGCSWDFPLKIFDASLSRLQQVAAAFDFIGYRGVDTSYHYFSMPNDVGYRIAISSLTIQTLPIRLGLCFFVTFHNDTLTIPDPAVMASVVPKDCDWALAW